LALMMMALRSFFAARSRASIVLWSALIGTLVNGILNGDHILSHGDDIQVGATVMRFVLGEPTEGDFVWPNMVHNIPQSGHTAAVSAIMEEPAIPAPRKKTSKLLIGILVVLIVGTIVLAALVIVFFAYGDKILGG